MPKLRSQNSAKQKKKENIRNQIIEAARTYSAELAGKVFLYVYGNEYFELMFTIDRFKHLTGVESPLFAKQFYTLAKGRKLTTSQFSFTRAHTYDSAKNKLPCLINLSVLTRSMVCVVKQLKTVTFTYSLGVTNLNFTLCLTEDVDNQGFKRSNYLLPRSLRVKDKAIENSTDSEFVDFIFVRDASKSVYTDLLYKSEDKNVPKLVEHLIDKRFYDDNSIN